MVEPAKERGGHDNITGVAIHVDEAPTRSRPSSATRPSRSTSGNPFSADEPTQTAFTAGGVTAPGSTVSLTTPEPQNHGRTVPMRAVADDFAEAPTLPPTKSPLKADGVKGKAKVSGGPASPPEVDTEAETLSDDDRAVEDRPSPTTSRASRTIRSRPRIPARRRRPELLLLFALVAAIPP